MLKKVSMIFGIVFLLVGLLGFVPGVVMTDSDGMQLLLGIFMVDPLHNGVHIASGILGLLGSTSSMYAKWYLVGFGAVYGLVTVLGFIDPTLFGLMMVNPADNYLHLALTVGLLGSGLFLKDDVMPAGKKAMM